MPTTRRPSDTARIKGWKLHNLPNLAGKRFLITGANSGLGFEVAKHLRRANADVVMTARSREKGTAALEAVRNSPGNGQLDLQLLDLANLDSIRAAAHELQDRYEGLDAVINNAGVRLSPQLKTADGFELQFGTNHLGHFLLNHLVFDLIAARAGRIVPVSSNAHLFARRINFDDVMFNRGYSPTKVYGHSKLANMMYGLELADRLAAIGSPVKSVIVHPGYSSTGLQSADSTGPLKWFYKLSDPVAQSPAEGAVPEALGAAGTEACNGGYYGPAWFGWTRGPVGDCLVSPAAKDPAARRKLWSLSEQLLDIEWPVGPIDQAGT